LFSGLLVTIGALSYGLYQMKTGDRAMSQKMMRLRVGAQAFTVAALLGGIVYQSNIKGKTANKSVKT
jgi:Hypoxia induced protein conserved region